MSRKSSITVLFSLIILCFVSCASIEPAYLIRAKSDNGFTIAYQAFFAVDGDSITSISKHHYELLTLGNSSKYERIQAKTYSFDVETAGNDPASWQYSQNEYDAENYSVQSLAGELRQMNLSYTGELYVLITIFDDYKIIEVSNMDGNTVLDSRFAVFNNNRSIPLSDNINLSSLSQFHRKR